MLKISGGDLPRRPSLGRDHEQMGVTWFQISRSVEPVYELVDYPGRIRPFRSRRGLRHLRNFSGRFRHEGGERNLFSVRRPRDAARRICQVGEFCGLASIEPATINLSGSVAVGDVDNLAAVG